MTAPPTTDLTAPSAADASARPYAVRPVRVGLQLQPQQADYAAIRRTVAAAEEIGVDVVFNWDHFFPLVRRSRRQALRVLDHARRLGRGDRARRDRRPRHLQQLPQPRPARRHGPHGRPHQRRPAHLRDRLGLVREGLRRVRLRVRHRRWRLDALGEALPRIERRLARLNPGPDPRHPRPDRRRRRAEDAAPRRQPRRHLARLRGARDRSPTSTTSSTSGAARPAATRARSSAPPAYPGTRSSSEPRRCTTSGRACSPSGSADRTTTSGRSVSWSSGATRSTRPDAVPRPRALAQNARRVT